MSETSTPPALKSVDLGLAAGTVRVGWFPGASREAVLAAVRGAAGLSGETAFHVETADGVTIALDDSVPAGTRLRLVVQGEVPSSAAPALHRPVPGPKPYPVVGNLPELHNAEGLVAAVDALHAKHGEFFAFQVGGKRAYFCSDADIISEMCAAPDVFAKLVEGRGGLGNLAEKSVGSALFTASDNDPLWHQAHRILAPAFGATALKNYYGRIVEVADDLLDHLDRLAPGESFLATDLMTRMTFEAISYAAFNRRYGAIDSPALPAFVEAMNVVLTDAMAEPKRLLPEVFYHEARKTRAAADKIMLEEVETIIAERRFAMAAGAPVPTDLLQVMLTTPDRVTGQKLPDDNIRGQLIVLLIAGHETTSGMLAYALYHLWKYPETMEKLIAEVDEVLGRDFSYKPTYEDVGRLAYTQRVLKEALRLCPPVPMFPRYVTRDATVGNGRYDLKAGERIFVSLSAMQKNPRFWGADALVFRPERFGPEEEKHHHPHAYHPFGMGARSCIGFQFALVEAKMVLARFIQRFTARPKDPHYVLCHKQALTVKPDHLDMLLERRPEVKGRFPVRTEAPKTQGAPLAVAQAGGRPMRVLYGSNMGGCRDIALSLAQQAGARGFAATVAELDEQVGQPWLTDGPVVIVTSTYNGTPPDNAARFAKWLETAPAGVCAGVRHAVLGCGNTQWHQTFQKFPKTIASGLAALGGTALLDEGTADAAGDYEAAVEGWTAALWPALEAAFGGAAGAAVIGSAEAAAEAPAVKVEVVNFAGAATGAAPRTGTRLDQGAQLSRIRVNRELLSPGAQGSTRHIEIPLPAGTSYAAGDHLAVFPVNPPALVAAAAARCGLAPETQVLLTALHPDAASEAGLPFGVPVSVGELLAEHVDLAGPVTRRDLRAWAQAAQCPPDRARIAGWLSDFPSAVAEAKPRMEDLLAQVPSVQLDLAALLTVRPALKPRYYSISSSPLMSPDACALTVGVHQFTTADGVRHDGLCSSYLVSCGEDAPVRVLVKDTGSTFHLPADPAVPLILVGPGTGLAPLRGFIQERHALRAQGRATGPVLLFFGCRDDGDYLYREELEAYRDEGTLSLLAVGFSRRPGTPRTYVQDLLRTHGDAVREQVAAGASILICGNARTMAPDVHAAFLELLGAGAVAELEAGGRYLQDVWASS
ncbi:FAD-binding oxidoreductase [Azorhizobium caulinodans ORS 571]|uniref:Bifunctional cytochrome P450/NADPH--P450 reductase n=1 Tax=Azorhizobium caulinodans (strain ATCC 43989 / DSM 5975 / JCM 20966 / LMG 6465 / NBRC 14845 / NCIMB 13405 / ORS 571) TaxID=438753 RepID=A8IEQ0_AZOC5|nr:cytochrome P450 [Azorhizobium caulinodans]BAF89518.1 FAD-binding oxidoreductase [Azorhizobium caulinodans ORS 571]